MRYLGCSVEPTKRIGAGIKTKKQKINLNIMGNAKLNNIVIMLIKARACEFLIRIFILTFYKLYQAQTTD